MTENISSKKYQDIKKKAKELFWRYGTKRVTIQEICHEARVSKMTYYKFFANKNELALLILKEIYEDAFKKFANLSNSDLPFSEKLEKIFLMKYEGTKDISIEFINDLYRNPDPEIVSFMNDLQEKATKLRTNFFKTAQKNGMIRKDIKLDFIMAFGDQITVMMENETLMASYDDPREFIMEALRLLFYGIVNRDA